MCFMSCAVLCCAVLCCAVLCCAVLCCAVLQCLSDGLQGFEQNRKLADTPFPFPW
jgi:hypothetical protein